MFATQTLEQTTDLLVNLVEGYDQAVNFFHRRHGPWAVNRPPSIVASHLLTYVVVRLVLPGVLLAVLGIVAVGCSPGQDAAGPESVAEQGLAHVHGLGVDPADGMLFAASHHGVYRLPASGAPELVGVRQDTMGFTVVGPHHFLGSGHPDPSNSDQPPHLGLIESTDAGKTWQSLSLGGEVDFHALEAKHNRVYGYDSQTGQLMASADRRTWDRRARIAMTDFAVHPTNSDEVLATTEQGLARSTDGGRTFTITSTPVPLLLIEWPAPELLVAVDTSGSVYRSTDSGASWSRQGAVRGQPGAVAAHGDSDVYVATDIGIYASGDGGRTFTLRQSMA